MPYTTADMTDIIVNNPKGAGGDTSVEVIFTPKVYQAPDNYIYRIEALAVVDIPDGRLLTLRSETAGNPITLQLAPNTTPPAQFFNTPFWEQWLMILSEAPEKTITVNIQDLVLDANWPEWLKVSSTAANATSPAYTDGFALNALRVTASQGTIKRVVVKNCGANGITPCPYWITQGREGFPLMVIASKPTLESDWSTGVENAPWKIQECEVYPLHGTHGGYCTSIQVKTPDPTKEGYPAMVESHRDYRVAVVERCQIRGNGLENGMGAANSFGVTYRDNVLVGVGLGLNHDTGCQRNFSIENNCFLDVYGVAHVGGPNWGPDSYKNYSIKDNLIRLRGVGSHQAYGDFRYANVTRGTFSAIQPFTDPTLAIGRPAELPACGLWLGGATEVYFNNNRFTTRPQSVFYELDPSQTANAYWRAVNADATDFWTTMPRYFGALLNYDNNSTSAKFMGFWLPNSTIATPTGNTAALYESPFPTGFVPGGSLGRVTPDCSASGNRLKGIWEVCVTEPTINGNVVTIKACTLYQPTALDTINSQTVIESPSTSPFDLRLAFFAANGAEVTLPVGQPQDAANIRTFQITLPSTANQYYRAVVYRRATSHIGFEEGRDAWSATEIHKGTTLRFDRVQDVANDRHFTVTPPVTALNPGYIRLRRGGTGTGSFPFTLRALLRSQTDNKRCATPESPGFSGADFRVEKSDGTVVNCNSAGVYTLDFPNNSTTMDLRIEPVAGTGDVIENEAAQFVLDFLQTPGGCAVAPAMPRCTSFPHYSVSGLTGSGYAVTLWDGPKYTFNQLYETYACVAGGSSMASFLASFEEVEELATEETEALVAEETALEPEPSNPPANRASALDESIPPMPAEFVEPIVTWNILEPEAAEGRFMTEAQTMMSATASTELQAKSTQVYALNETLTYPRLAGYATIDNPSTLCGKPATFDVGGGWMVPYYAKMQVEVENAKFYGVDNQGNRVGLSQNKACYLPAASEFGYELPAITPGPTSQGNAWWVSPNGAKIAGHSTKVDGATTCTRPTLWTAAGGGNFAARDLGSFGGTSATATGVALMVNDAGFVVGKAKDGNYNRAFRDMNYDTVLDTKLDFVPAPEGTQLDVSSANGVNSAGDAVGSSDTEVRRGGWYTYSKANRATLWWAGSNVPVPLGTVYPIDPNEPVNDPGESWALAANKMTKQVGNKVFVTTMVVGSSWTTPSGDFVNGAAYAVAFAVLDVPAGSSFRTPRTDLFMVNLNDAYLTYFPPPLDRAQWNLKSAEAINNQGVIVGNGTWHPTNPYDASAQQWGWILIPQPEALP